MAYSGKGLTNLMGYSTTPPIKEVWQLTEEQKTLINFMVLFFESDRWNQWSFKVCTGKFENGEDQWRPMKGWEICKYLQIYLNFGRYKTGGRGILNGIRKCYIERNK